MRTQSSSFSRTERQLLDAIGGILIGEALAIFQAQVAAINLVQRHPHGAIVTFYRKRWWHVNWKGVLLFPREDEFRFAKVSFKAGGKRFKAVLTCIKGHIFDFSISPSPTQVWDQSFEEAPKVALLEDPMILDPKATVSEIVPEEWVRIRSNLASIQHTGWRLHDAHTAYCLPMEDGEYLVLAERGGQEFVLWKLDPPDSRFYHMPEHDSEPVAVTTDLLEVFTSPER